MVEWLAQRLSTGSPNGLVLARPTSFDGSPQPRLMARPMSTGSPKTGSPNLVSLTLVAPMSQKFQSFRGGRTAARFFFANGCEAPAARHSPAAPARHCRAKVGILLTEVGIPTSLYTEVGFPTSL